MKASYSAGRATRATMLSNISLATRADVLIWVSRMFDCGGKSIPSFNCSGVTWSATACGWTCSTIKGGDVATPTINSTVLTQRVVTQVTVNALESSTAKTLFDGGKSKSFCERPANQPGPPATTLTP